MRFKGLLIAALVAISFVGIYTSNASAAEDGIVPFVKVDVFAGFTDVNKDYVIRNQTTGTSATASVANAKGDRDFTLQTASPGSSKFGVGATKGNLYVRGEIAFASEASTQIQYKALFATYKLNAFEIQFGRYQAPYASESFNPTMDVADAAAMTSEGSSFDSWQQQIKFAFMGAYINFQMPQYGRGASVLASSTNGGKARTDVVIPKIAVGYVMPGPMRVGAHFVVQQIKIDDMDATPPAYNGEKVLSYSGNVTANLAMPFGLIHANAFYSQNQGDMGFFTNSSGFAVANGDSIEDTKGYGGNVGVSFKLGQFTPAVGIGYEIFDNDQFAEKDDAIFYFASLQYAVEPTVIIAPCFKYNDYRKGTADQEDGKKMWYGVEFIAGI